MFSPIYGKLYEPIIKNNLAQAESEIRADPSVITQKYITNDDLFLQETNLHLAAERGSYEMVRLLLDNLGDGDVNIRDKGGFTPLFRAVGRASPEVVQLLIDRGADVHALNNSGVNALHQLNFGRGDPLKLARGEAILKILIDAGIDVNNRNFFGEPFLSTVVFNPARVAKTLLDAGANANAVSKGRITPLYAAIFNSPSPHIDVLKVLIEYGADVNYIKDEKSILQLVKESRRKPKEIKTLLETYPAWVRRRHAMAAIARAGAGASTATRRGGGKRSRRSMRQRQRLRQSRRH